MFVLKREQNAREAYHLARRDTKSRNQDEICSHYNFNGLLIRNKVCTEYIKHVKIILLKGSQHGMKMSNIFSTDSTFRDETQKENLLRLIWFA